MKQLNDLNRVDIYGDGTLGDEYNGAFRINDGKEYFFVIASNGFGFDHVSVSKCRNNGASVKKCPTLDEMKKIKNLFFNEDEIVYQVFPAKEDYINQHPYCLHLWRPNDRNFALPMQKDIDEKEILETKTIDLEDCLCHYKLIDLNDWTLLRAYITKYNLKPIKSGPSWEQTCQIKEQVFGVDDACAQFIFNSNHESSVDVYMPKDPNLLILPPSILVGYKKKY